MEKNDLRILLVDDDLALSGMLREYLTAEGFPTDAVHHGEAGIKAALSGDYAAVILDVMLPQISGMDILQRIRQSSAVPVIMLTAKGDNVDRVIGLEMGADDYVPKPCYPRELVARLRAVLRRTHADKTPQVDETYAFGDLQLQMAQRSAQWRGAPLDLTVTEFNFLAQLMAHSDRVVTKDELSETGLGRKREPYDRSVDVHVSNLRQKLQAAAKDLNIETVRGIGYRLRQE